MGIWRDANLRPEILALRATSDAANCGLREAMLAGGKQHRPQRLIGPHVTNQILKKDLYPIRRTGDRNPNGRPALRTNHGFPAHSVRDLMTERMTISTSWLWSAGVVKTCESGWSNEAIGGIVIEEPVDGLGRKSQGLIAPSV